MLKPLIATKAINRISRGLFTAAKNSVGRVKESTQKITKGLDKDQKFPMNYVEFFGSKKTVKILRKNLKSVRDSLTSTFGFVSTLTKTVGGLFKKLGPGGLFAGLVGTIGATIFGGIFGIVRGYIIFIILIVFIYNSFSFNSLPELFSGGVFEDLVNYGIDLLSTSDNFNL